MSDGTSSTWGGGATLELVMMWVFIIRGGCHSDQSSISNQQLKKKGMKPALILLRF